MNLEDFPSVCGSVGGLERNRFINWPTRHVKRSRIVDCLCGFARLLPLFVSDTFNAIKTQDNFMQLLPFWPVMYTFQWHLQLLHPKAKQFQKVHKSLKCSMHTVLKVSNKGLQASQKVELHSHCTTHSLYSPSPIITVELNQPASSEFSTPQPSVVHNAALYITIGQPSIKLTQRESLCFPFCFVHLLQ